MFHVNPAAWFKFDFNAYIYVSLSPSETKKNPQQLRNGFPISDKHDTDHQYFNLELYPGDFYLKGIKRRYKNSF